ncbi:thiamine pyrophosphate-dependent enzyme [Portibacter marinus]|uniref:thiamine pyrophosphate-dependent enzyme n=1 Tax=Portibacter marinus TaxID=2898660 RepID=UPI001F1C8850|nr:thiamine pyrophosphate-dependent enzyme [Portibacter marinus]
MAANISSFICDKLEEVGVQHVFGVTGDALNYFVKAINESEALQWVGVRHEQNGAFAAYAQACLSQTLGVCAGTVGPGALHLVNGLYSAKRERVPMLAITGQIESSRLGTNYFQEVDLKKIFDDVCAFQAIIRTPEDAVRNVQKAIRIALSERTVCRIELPADLADIEIDHQKFSHHPLNPKSTLHPDIQDIRKAANMVNEAEHITILAGSGCRHAKEEVLALSDKINAPIVYTLRSADIFDMETDRVVGQTGLIGNPSGYQSIMNCDLLLMVGTDFPYDEFLPHETNTIQIDIESRNIGNRTSVQVGIHGDAGQSVKMLLKEIDKKTDQQFLDKYRASYLDWRKEKSKEASPENITEPLNPLLFTNMVDYHAHDDAIFTLDTSTAAIWASRTMVFGKERRILGSFNHGSMAVALPAAIGAQMLLPEREVWALTGDGGFVMAMQDFITACELKLPIKIIIFNNNELSLIKLEMEKAGEAPNYDSSKLTNPDFVAFAEACGGEGVSVKKGHQLEEAVLRAKNSAVPFIIDAHVNSGKIPLPPHLGVNDTIQLMKSKLKEITKGLKGEKSQLENMINELKGFLS